MTVKKCAAASACTYILTCFTSPVKLMRRVNVEQKTHNRENHIGTKLEPLIACADKDEGNVKIVFESKRGKCIQSPERTENFKSQSV